MCLNCGSFGKPNDSQVVACSQCGQCYHTYCADIKVCNVMLEKGWRCLDCTVCEGCGKATDESRLLLCDDCDISYHIYCLDPPLDQVPKGNWKCKWCVRCHKCGAKTPGSATLEWKNNYTECALCHSLAVCHMCEQAYKEPELISKCLHCDRWSHISCKSCLGEDEAAKLVRHGFSCAKCQKGKELDVALKDEMSAKSQTDLLDEICKQSIEILAYYLWINKFFLLSTIV